MMKNILTLMLVTAVAVIMTGCDKAAEETSQAVKKATDVTKVSLESDLCGKCGCCADCDSHCEEDGKKCDDCGMKPGSALCCTGVEPADVVYCKGCGHEKGTEKCCADTNETCACGMAKGSTLCCKLKKDSDADSDVEEKEADSE